MIPQVCKGQMGSGRDLRVINDEFNVCYAMRRCFQLTLSVEHLSLGEQSVRNFKFVISHLSTDASISAV